MISHGASRALASWAAGVSRGGVHLKSTSAGYAVYCLSVVVFYWLEQVTTIHFQILLSFFGEQAVENSLLHNIWEIWETRIWFCLSLLKSVRWYWLSGQKRSPGSGIYSSLLYLNMFARVQAGGDSALHLQHVRRCFYSWSSKGFQLWANAIQGELLLFPEAFNPVFISFYLKVSLVLIMSSFMSILSSSQISPKKHQRKGN